MPPLVVAAAGDTVPSAADGKLTAVTGKADESTAWAFELNEKPAVIGFVSPFVSTRPRCAVTPKTSHGLNAAGPALDSQPGPPPGPALHPHQLLVASTGSPPVLFTPAPPFDTIRLKWTASPPGTAPPLTEIPSPALPWRSLPTSVIALFGFGTMPPLSARLIAEKVDPDTSLPLTSRSALPPDRATPAPVFPVMVLPDTTPWCTLRSSMEPSFELVLPVIEGPEL